MKKYFLFFVVLSLVLVGCKSPESPVGPEPEPEPLKYYDLEITYIRTEVVCPEVLSDIPDFVIYYVNSGGYLKPIVDDINFQRIDDYTFRAEVPHIQALVREGEEKLYAFYAIYVLDRTRGYYIAENGKVSVTPVADKIIIKVKETGFEKEVKDIRGNAAYGKGEWGLWILVNNGTIISDVH